MRSLKSGRFLSYSKRVLLINDESLNCCHTLTVRGAQSFQFIHPRTAYKICAASNVCISGNDIISQAEVARGQFEVVLACKPANEPIAVAPNNPCHVGIPAPPG